MHPHIVTVVFILIFVVVLLTSFVNLGDILIIGFMIFLYVISMGFFNFEVNKAIKILEEIFQVSETPY